MTIRHDFGVEQVDAAIEYVIKNGAEDRGLTVSYTRVFEAAELPAPQVLHQGGDSHLVTAFMEAFHNRCENRELPPLDALVVHVAGVRENKPGAGYFRVNGYADPFGQRAKAEEVVAAYRFWDAQLRECRTWGSRSRRGNT
jgi:hypothetical protein